MLTKIKVYGRNTVKIYKNKPQFFFKPSGARPARRSWIRLWVERSNRLLHRRGFSENDYAAYNCLESGCVYITEWQITVRSI